MKKKVLCLIGIVLLGIILFSINRKQYGYIKDINSNLPIEGVLVKDFINQKRYTVTDKDGMFSFSNCNDLLISKKEYKSDTLKKYGCKPTGKCFNGHVFYMTLLKQKNDKK